MSYRTIATFTRCSTFKFEASDQIEDTVVCLKLQFKNTPTVWASNLPIKQLLECQRSRPLTFSIWKCSVSYPITVSTSRRTEKSCLTKDLGRESLFFVQAFVIQCLW